MEANQEARPAKDAGTRMALERLQLRRQALKDAGLAYHYALQRARLMGASVADIAQAAGISRTAVYKQLNRKEG